MYKKKKKHIPAIVLGCHKLGLGVIRALGEMGVPVLAVYYNDKDMGFVSKFVSWRFKAPHPDHDPQGFIDVLNSLDKSFYGSVIMPSDDATQLVVSKHKELLCKSFRVSCSDWQTTEKILVKKNTYKIAKEAGVPAPETLVPRSIGEAREFAEKVGYPCIIKPCLGHKFFEKNRKKMLMIDNENALEKTLSESVLGSFEMMVQEFVPGDDTCGYNYNSLYRDGRPIVEFTSQKLRLSPPMMGFPRVIVSRNVSQVMSLGRQILGALGYTGFSCTEFKQDARNGVFKLMEINGRQNLSTPLAVKCGINFPYLTYMYEAMGTVPSVSSHFSEGVYWIDAEKDFLELLIELRTRNTNRRLLNYFLPYLKPKVFSILSISDPMPALKRVWDIGKAFADRGRNKIEIVTVMGTIQK